MKIPYLKQICLYLIIIALLLCVLSLIIPIGTINLKTEKFSTYTDNDQFEFFTWGTHTIIENQNYWVIIYDSSYFVLFSLTSEEQINNIALTLGMYYLLLPITLIIIFLGAISSYSIHYKKEKFNLLLVCGILSILTLFFFYIFINFGYFSIDELLKFKPYFSFSFSFYFLLFSGILFFISYFFSKVFYKDIES